MVEETSIGFRATKSFVQECGAVSNVVITLDMGRAAEDSYQIYTEHMRQEIAKK